MMYQTFFLYLSSFLKPKANLPPTIALGLPLTLKFMP